MADTENAAAAATNPAEVSKTESSDLKSDAKTTTSADVAADSKTEAGEEKWQLNGKSEERRGGRNDRNGRDYNDRRGGQRGRGRGRGGFQNNNKKCDSLCATLHTYN